MLSMGNSLGSFSPLTAPLSLSPVSSGLSNQNTVGLPLGAQGFNTPSAVGQQQPTSQFSPLSTLAGDLEGKGNMLLQLAGMVRMLLQLLSALQSIDPTANQTPPAYDGGNNGQYHGDPHLVGFDGEKYDVMGQPGKTYNMLSDKNVEYNTTFEQWGGNGATVIGKAGIQVGNDQVYFDRSGNAPTVNGKPMEQGQEIQLDKGGKARWDGQKLTVDTGEYAIDLQVKEPNNPNGPYINSHVSINKGGPFSNFVAPHGLLGQTADSVKGEKNTGIDQGKQGGTVIDGTVNDYEVSDLWSHDSKFNRFDVQIGQVISNPTDGSVAKVLDTQGNVIFQAPPSASTLGGISTAA